MLTPKAPVLAAATLALGVIALAFQLAGAAVLSAGLAILFAINGLSLARPTVEATVAVDQDHATEGQTLAARIELANTGKRPLVVEHRLDLPETFEVPGHPPVGTRALVGGEAHAFTVETIPRLFGVHELGPLRARVSDPSALRTIEHEVSQARRMMVHPATERLKTVSLGLQENVSFLGVTEAGQPGDGFEFYTLRQYQSGDNVRMINWRASARSEDLIVNQRTRESHVEVTVLLDARAHSHDGQLVASPLAECTRASATLMDFLLHRRDHVEFYMITDQLTHVHSTTPTRQRLQIMEALCTTRPSGGMRFSEVHQRVLPNLPKAGPVIIASGFETDPTVVPVVRELIAREHDVMILSAPTRGLEDVASQAEIEARRAMRAYIRDRISSTGATWVELDHETPFSSTLLEATLG